jgi:hypothetical protein
MVICASNADHTLVKLLEPPNDANIGDRVTFDGFTGEPASASALAKKKILEKLLPEVCCLSRLLISASTNHCPSDEDE